MNKFLLIITASCFSFGMFAADGDVAALRQEIQAIREAYESRIATLETEVKTLKSGSTTAGRGIDQTVNDALFKRDGTSIPAPSSPSLGKAVQASTQITLGGYTEFSYTDRNTRTPSFDANRTVAQLGVKLDDKIHLYLELEQEHGGSIEGGGTPSDGEIEVEQAYLDYTIDKAINFRAGIVLAPIGHYNEYHEGFLNNFVDRPLVDRRVIPTTWFEEGVGFYGTPVDSDKLGISYEAYMFNPANADSVDPISGFRGIRNEGNPATSDQKAGAVRVALEPARGFKRFADNFEIGLSGYVSGFHGFTGPNADGDIVHLNSGLLNLEAFDLTYEKKNFGFRGEAALAHTQKGENSTDLAQTAWGYYAEAYYKFWPKFLSSSPFGKFKDPKIVAAIRYDYVDLNTQAAATPSIQRVTAGISYRPLPRTVFKFDYQLDWLGSGIVGQNYDEPKELETGLHKHNHAFLFGVTTGF